MYGLLGARDKPARPAAGEVSVTRRRRDPRNRLARIGFDAVVGHLDGGIAAAPASRLRTASRLTAAQFAAADGPCR